MLKTTDYDKFILTDKNRNQIKKSNIVKVVNSILTKNLLHLRPIEVNSKMEVIDGQHRLLAAKSLGLPIYYVVKDELEDDDIILLNQSTNWENADYFNYYIKKGNPNYINLDRFIKTHNLPLSIALRVIRKENEDVLKLFRNGDLKFKNEDMGSLIEWCHETEGYIRLMNEKSSYVKSWRFWKAMLKLFRHPNFEYEQFRKNLEKLIGRLGPRYSSEDYFKELRYVYNHGLRFKIYFNNEEDSE